MKKDLLFPTRYRQIGWWLLIPSVLLGLSEMYAYSMPEGWVMRQLVIDWFLPAVGSFADEMAALGVILGLLFIAFAREKTEDEMIRQLRLESLQWSVYINYFLLALAIALVYDDAFFTVMIYNMFTVLVVFIVRFRWSLKRVERPEEVIA